MFPQNTDFIIVILIDINASYKKYKKKKKS